MLSSHGVLSQLHFLVCWSVLNTNLVSFPYTVKWWAIFQSALWKLKSLKPLSIEKNLWTLNPPFKLVGKYLLQPLWTRENMRTNANVHPWGDICTGGTSLHVCCDMALRNNGIAQNVKEHMEQTVQLKCGLCTPCRLKMKELNVCASHLSIGSKRRKFKCQEDPEAQVRQYYTVHMALNREDSHQAQAGCVV